MMAALTPHLPVLQVVLPLMAAPLCVLLRRQNLAWWVYLLTTWSCLAVSLLLAAQALSQGAFSYALGGWAPPVGIEYRVDQFNAFVLVIVSGMAAVLAPYARASVRAEISDDRAYLFYAMLLLCLCGLLGITITGDAFNVFVFLEISSLASYGLIAMGRHRRALMAAFEYLIMGTIGGTFILIGIGLLYMMTGTLNMADLAARLPEVMDTRTVQAAVAFIVVGASLKLALLPLHAWLPGAYGEAPSVVSAFLAATATKVAAYVLIRFVYTVFGAGFAFGALPLSEILIVLSVAAMLYGSLAAVFADDVKRLLAWSSVAQIGYIVLGMALVTPEGLTASILHLLNHGVVKGALFLAVGCMVWRLRDSRLSALAGLGRRMPWTAAAFVVGALALIGVPATAGFISKWTLLQAVIDVGAVWLVVAILVSSLLAVVYLGRVIEVMYFQPPPADDAMRAEAPASMRAMTGLLVGVSVSIGVYATPMVDYARGAALGLIGGTP